MITELSVNGIIEHYLSASTKPLVTEHIKNFCGVVLDSPWCSEW
ncbi:MAG: hypothetical protein V7735_09245 [Photobacterium frigidiphilum]